MKKLLVLPVLMASFVFAGCFGPDVVDYNDKIVDLAGACLDSEVVMEDAIDASGATVETAKAAYDTTLAVCKTSRDDIKAMDSFDDDSALRDAAVTFLDAEIAYLEKYGRYVELYFYSDEEWTDALETEYNALEDELDTLWDVSDKANDTLISTQETFATKHGYELED